MEVIMAQTRQHTGRAGRRAVQARYNRQDKTRQGVKRTRQRLRGRRQTAKQLDAQILRKKIEDYMIVRITLMFLAFAVGFGILGFTVYHAIRQKGESYRKRALSQQTYVSRDIPYRRGQIQDRNGTVFVRSKTVYNLIISPKDIMAKDSQTGKRKWKKPAFEALETYFGMDEAQIQEIIDGRESLQYVILLRDLEAEIVEEYEDAIKKEKEAIEQRNKKRTEGEKKEEYVDLGNCIYFELNYKRIYPLKTIASNVIGFATENSKYGLENYYDQELSGTNGKNFGYFNSDGELERTVNPASDGYTVVTTLDANVQQLVEKRIRNFQEKRMGAKRVAVVLSNPQNGEIYAMASTNSFDPNHPSDLSSYYTKQEIKGMSEEEYAENCNEMWKNFCVSDAYEPGSTFKPYTVAAALDEALASNKSTYECDGSQVFSGWPKPIKCTHVHGSITLGETIMFSCNDAIMQIGAKLGRTRFYKYEHIFGLGQKTGVDLPGESAGILLSESQLTPVDLATSSFGQSNTVTMMQMIAGFSSIINGGNYYIPHVMKRIVDSSGAIVKTYQTDVVRKTVSEDTSALLKKYLLQTVEDHEGTATGAHIKGYEIGGKTGTAEKHPRGRGNYLLSFIGYVGYDTPELVIYVIIDEPHVEDQAHSSFATTFAAEILKDVMPFLGIYRADN